MWHSTTRAKQQKSKVFPNTWYILFIHKVWLWKISERQSPLLDNSRSENLIRMDFILRKVVHFSKIPRKHSGSTSIIRKIRNRGIRDISQVDKAINRAWSSPRQAWYTNHKSVRLSFLPVLPKVFQKMLNK